MKLLLALTCLVPLVAASIFKDWHPPVPGDVRSPCPALNSLAIVRSRIRNLDSATHGYI